MKKLLMLLGLLFFVTSVNAEVLKAGVSETKVPMGFFGTWHVTSKMHKSSNPEKFNPLSVDIWSLGGYSNILILENPMTGATSQIQVEDKNIEGKTLKFTRFKEEQSGIYKTKYIESPEITLTGDIFKGYDTFIIESYKNNVLLQKDVVIYKVIGQKISGETKLNE